jgi:hypothetical protein
MSMAGCANCTMQAQLIASQAQMIAMLQQQLAAATGGGGAAGPPVAVAMAVAEAPSPAALPEGVPRGGGRGGLPRVESMDDLAAALGEKTVDLITLTRPELEELLMRRAADCVVTVMGRKRILDAEARRRRLVATQKCWACTQPMPADYSGKGPISSRKCRSPYTRGLWCCIGGCN